jgi:hypothetical protein
LLHEGLFVHSEHLNLLIVSASGRVIAMLLLLLMMMITVMVMVMVMVID